jgi:hypothetical protein
MISAFRLKAICPQTNMVTAYVNVNPPHLKKREVGIYLKGKQWRYIKSDRPLTAVDNDYCNLQFNLITTDGSDFDYMRTDLEPEFAS